MAGQHGIAIDVEMGVNTGSNTAYRTADGHADIVAENGSANTTHNQASDAGSIRRLQWELNEIRVARSATVTGTFGTTSVDVVTLNAAVGLGK